jgi:hypothetical protein
MNGNEIAAKWILELGSRIGSGQRLAIDRIAAVLQDRISIERL